METFIVRVWVPPYSSEKEQPLCGVVEHIAAKGSETTFVDEGELLAMLRAPMREPAPVRLVGGTPWGDQGS
jgi:hypothetical protein